MVKVRVASTADAESILEIYAPYIVSTAFTFETRLPSLQEFSTRIEKCLEKYPWLVCEIDEKIAGYVYASPHREREAYQWTCECSVYVSEHHRGKGIALALYETLFTILKCQGLFNVYAGITLPNDASVALHEKCGFVPFAVYDNIGYKLNNWHKVGWWQLQLSDYVVEPPPPLKFPLIHPGQLAELFNKAARKIESNIIG